MDQSTRQRYELWLTSPAIDQVTRRELEAIEGDEKEIEDRFFQELTFGTGGLRGILGAGTNRMNVYMVRKAAQGLADYILQHGEAAARRGVVIAHDCRRMSREFCLEAACVLAANHITAYIFDDLRPTPQLSFAVRNKGAIAGIVVTASHNPPEYNGFKVYWEDGAQVSTAIADAITTAIQAIDGFEAVKVMPEVEARQSGRLKELDASMDEAYLEAVLSQSLRQDAVQQVADTFKVVYTPLHGTGAKLVPEALKRAGFRRVLVEPSQAVPDPDFSTVKSPNPEEKAAFELAIRLAEKEGADLIIGTDPDGDRVGALVKDREGNYVVLTGNQTGALLVDYIIRTRRERDMLPANSLVVKTIVTSEMGAVIAKAQGASMENTLTGFKYIGDRIKHYETTGEKQFLFGYEESYGYLSGTYARDKDAVVAALLIAEMAAVYALEGLSLYEGLLRLYDTYGYYMEDLVSITLKGKEGMEKIDAIMSRFRQNPPVSLGGTSVTEVEDYENMAGFPAANVIKMILGEAGWVALRPSGTEPKLKIYAGVCTGSLEASRQQLETWMAAMNQLVE
ncbi:phospho-sugar mutase [Anoxynatronum buryatiense]|uniref:Phosphoglucomutase n=1 Tax=Anoxynatronum buryatiense TaxID=489973 RepID=A0AA46AIN6_9CLOT|nr:phospho-sugar mutase [Anoxynatronum buryatiense]SMP52436.1 phosphoglucomutase [Anoxynatronum buryatiense]